jgi:hypothetical protein
MLLISASASGALGGMYQLRGRKSHVVPELAAGLRADTLNLETILG